MQVFSPAKTTSGQILRFGLLEKQQLRCEASELATPPIYGPCVVLWVAVSWLEPKAKHVSTFYLN